MFTEANGSTFSQACDPDDIAETLQAMVKKEATPKTEITLNRLTLGNFGLVEDCFKKAEVDE